MKNAYNPQNANYAMLCGGRPARIWWGLPPFISTFYIFTFMLLASLSLAQDSSPAAAKTKTLVDVPLTNEMCPVLTDERADPNIYVQYNGKRVQFCCTRCRANFLSDPEAYVTNLPQFNSAEVENQESSVPLMDEESHHDVDHNHMMSNPEMMEKHMNADHDHELDHGPTSASEKMSLSTRVIGFVGKFHPVIVHFPIALLILAFFSSLLNTVWPANLFRYGSRLCLWAGTLGAAAAAVLGWMNASAFYSTVASDALALHRWLGISTAILSLIALCVAEMAWKKSSPGWKRAAIIILLIVAVIVGATGHLGATLVYGPNYFTF